MRGGMTTAEAIAAWNTRHTATAEALEAMREARGALQEARAALHFHYVEWDGEPEDAVPLQLARSKCDANLTRLTAAIAKIGGDTK